MKDVTPQEMRCNIRACPTLYEVTPAPCAIAISCPALYEQEDGYIIIGKIMREEDIPAEVKAKCGEDEAVTWVPKRLLKGNEALK